MSISGIKFNFKIGMPVSNTFSKVREEIAFIHIARLSDRSGRKLKSQDRINNGGSHGIISKDSFNFTRKEFTWPYTDSGISILGKFRTFNGISILRYSDYMGMIFKG